MQIFAIGYPKPRLLAFLAGAVTSVIAISLYLAALRAWRAHQVLGSVRDVHWDGLSASYVGSAGIVDVVRGAGSLVEGLPQERLFIYIRGARVLSLDVDSGNASQFDHVYLGTTELMHARRSGRPDYVELTFKLPQGSVHYADRNCDGVFDARWDKSPNYDNPRQADIWINNQWVAVDPDGILMNRTTVLGDTPVDAVFANGHWRLETASAPAR